MPGFTVTRGVGPGATPTNLIVRGFLPEEVELIFAGGSRFAKKALEDLYENIKISAMLVSANGKELIKPIINVINKNYTDDKDITVKILPLKIVAREANNIKVSTKLVKRKK